MKQQIQDQLITDLSALTFVGGTTIFSSVKKFFRDRQDPLTCSVTPQTTAIDIIGNTADERNYSFVIDFYETIEATASQQEAENRINRIFNIEDAILDYIQQEPQPLTSSVSLTNGSIIKVRPTNTTTEVIQTERGLSYLTRITATITVLITPQTL